MTDSMDAAFEGADVVYPKSWGPYDLMLERVEANRQRDDAAMKDIERRCLDLNRSYTDWICDERRMGLTRDGKAETHRRRGGDAFVREPGVCLAVPRPEPRLQG